VSYYGIHVGATGYVSFQECVEKCRRFRELRLGIRELYYVVQQNGKGRFGLSPPNVSEALKRPHAQIFMKPTQGQTDPKMILNIPMLDTERVHLEHVVHGTVLESVPSIVD
jgi:RNA:NAD 2'-phosphotransferase (TPT1/KptA family)